VRYANTHENFGNCVSIENAPYPNTTRISRRLLSAFHIISTMSKVHQKRRPHSNLWRYRPLRSPSFSVHSASRVTRIEHTSRRSSRRILCTGQHIYVPHQASRLHQTLYIGSARPRVRLSQYDRIYPPEAEPDINTTIPVSALGILPTPSSGPCMSSRILDLTTTERQGFSTPLELCNDGARVLGMVQPSLPSGPTSVFAPAIAGCSSRVPSHRADCYFLPAVRP
jgi:hypothetical protein